jgi:hypothetical protein
MRTMFSTAQKKLKKKIVTFGGVRRSVTDGRKAPSRTAESRLMMAETASSRKNLTMSGMAGILDDGTLVSNAIIL